MVPVVIEQYIQKLLSHETPRYEKQNIRYVLATVRDVCDKAIQKFDARHG